MKESVKIDVSTLTHKTIFTEMAFYLKTWRLPFWKISVGVKRTVKQ
ncbi:MAG TPA: hypothetical protein VIJ57_12265 [Hanamia sp.]